ncbi:MAG: hypothetical protein ABI162_10570 [Luteolibacter sp.]
MKDDNKPTEPAGVGLHNHPPKNDGPDETPVYEDLYHDDGRRNILEEEEKAKAEERRTPNGKH